MQRRTLRSPVSRFATGSMNRWISLASGPAVAALLGVWPIAMMPAAAQAPPRPPAEIPYLPFGPVSPIPGQPAGSAADPAALPPGDAETLKKRDHDLEAIRSEQTKAIETEARLKREIESI